MTTFDVIKAETVKQVSGSQEFGELIGMIAKLQTIAPTIKVVDEGSNAMGSEFVLQVKQTEKSFEALRKSGNAPYLEMKRAIDSVFTPLVETCKRIRAPIERQLVEYKVKLTEELEQKQKEAMEKEIAAKEAGVEGPPPEYPLFFPGATQTDSGETTTRKMLKFEVIDWVKLVKSALDKRNRIPVDVATFNEAKLRQAVNAKLFSQKNWAKYGVRVYEEETVVSRGK